MLFRDRGVERGGLHLVHAYTQSNVCLLYNADFLGCMTQLCLV
jgi:hypothetical protein